MKIKSLLYSALLGAMLCAPTAGFALFTQGQSFVGAIVAAGAESTPSAGNAADSAAYAEGMRAINRSDWSNAVSIFTKVAQQRSHHADGSLFWKAYAENRLGQSRHAMDSCMALRRGFPLSLWIDECDALEIEMHAKSGQPAPLNAEKSDDLKLLALNSMLRTNEPRAMAEIQEILNGNSSEKLKKEAQFILGQHYSNATYAQIARISYVEGDVRIARGRQNEQITGAAWEKAVADLQLKTGYSLVTGAGRAEIELEDASTLYLGENSVLTFNDLHTTGGVPYAELALLAGTLSAHVIPYSQGQSILLRTLTDDRYLTSNPGNACLRVSSYADGTAVTPLDGWNLRLGGETVANGETVFLREGRRVTFVVAAGAPNAFAAWDSWVADRVAQRTAAMDEVMQESGLTQPVPGLAELRGLGTFFDCAPYGTCWEPLGVNDRQPANNEVAASQPTSAPSSDAASQKPPKTAQKISTAPNDLDNFPCLPAALRYGLVRDTVTGKENVVSVPSYKDSVHYRWAVCHVGSWIHQRDHYVWVVGHKRHHIEPVRWIRSGQTVAFVPLHPYDVRGRPPLNRKEGVFAVRYQDGRSIERINLDPESPIEFSEKLPKEFRTPYLHPLRAADAPRMQAQLLRVPSASKGGLARPGAGIPLIFDPKSQSFMTARQITQGNRSVTVVAPVANRSGSLQPVSGGVHAIGSNRGGGGSNGASGGSHAGGGGSSSRGSSSAGSPSSTRSSGGSSAASTGSSSTHH
jgi:hypothetical protein